MDANEVRESARMSVKGVGAVFACIRVHSRMGLALIVRVMVGAALLCVTVPPHMSAQEGTLRELRRISATANDLSRVAEAGVGADGAIWIWQPEDGVIVGFVPGATKARTVGASGAGPGDIRNVAQLFVRPNGLWVVDWTLQRSTSFDASGRVDSTATIRAPAGLASPRLRAAAPAGGASWWQSRGDSGSTIYSIRREEGEPPTTVLLWPKASCSLRRPTEKGSVSIFVPYCHTPRIAFSANGKFGAEAVPMMPVDGNSEIRVVVVSVNGDTVFNRRLALTPSPIPGSVRDSAINFRLGRAGRVLHELYQAMDRRDLVPRVYSPVVDLRVSDAGDVVVDVVTGPAAERRLAVLRSGSPTVSMLPMKTTQSLRWFGGNHLLLTDEDADGLQDVVLYEIVGKR